jgi:chromosome segregation ATPase
MKEDYAPNEKNRNMFGVERNGYGCERVDLYLTQLEMAFKKIREDNRGLKQELASAAAQQQNFSLQASAQPDPERERQLAESQEHITRLRLQLGEAQEQNRLLLTRLNEQAYTQQQTDALLSQIAALRSEADGLRKELRLQAAAPAFCEPAQDEEKQRMIGRVLIDAQAQAEETVRKATQEAEAVTQKAQQRVSERQAEVQRLQAEVQRLQTEHQRVFSHLQAERQRIYSQLQGTYHALRNALTDPMDPMDPMAEYRQRGEEFAAG